MFRFLLTAKSDDFFILIYRSSQCLILKKKDIFQRNLKPDFDIHVLETFTTGLGYEKVFKTV